MWYSQMVACQMMEDIGPTNYHYFIVLSHQMFPLHRVTGLKVFGCNGQVWLTQSHVYS